MSCKQNDVYFEYMIQELEKAMIKREVSKQVQ